jgi:hypothetical protein
MLEDLKTLGYIGGSSSPKKEGSKPTAPPEAGDAPRR